MYIQPCCAKNVPLALTFFTKQFDFDSFACF